MLKLKGLDPGEIYGAFGSKTEGALQTLQEAAAIQVDGIYGPISEAALQGSAMGVGAPEDSNPPPGRI